MISNPFVLYFWDALIRWISIQSPAGSSVLYHFNFVTIRLGVWTPYRSSVLALTVKIRKSQDFLAPISGSPGDQIISFTFRNSTSIFLNSQITHKFILNFCYKWLNIFKSWESQISWHWFLEVQDNFCESLTSRLPLMQALVVVFKLRPDKCLYAAWRTLGCLHLIFHLINPTCLDPENFCAISRISPRISSTRVQCTNHQQFRIRDQSGQKEFRHKKKSSTTVSVLSFGC